MTAAPDYGWLVRLLRTAMDDGRRAYDLETTEDLCGDAADAIEVLAARVAELERHKSQDAEVIAHTYSRRIAALEADLREAKMTLESSQAEARARHSISSSFVAARIEELAPPHPSGGDDADRRSARLRASGSADLADRPGEAK